MSQVVDVQQIIRADAAWRPQANHRQLSESLCALFEDRGTNLVLDHLRTLGTGNPRLARTARPLMAQSIRKLVDALSVLYAVPATRRLYVAGTDELVPDDSLAGEALRDALTACQYDQAWRAIDTARNLYRQCVVSLAENHERRAVDLLVFEPHNVFRSYSPAAGNSLESDSAFLLRVRDGGFEEHASLYQAWVRAGAGWRCWVVNGRGELEGEQPYGESGEPPFAELPAFVVFDGYCVRPWLPISESRLSYALSITSQLNDLEFLVTQEAHTRFLHKTDNNAATIQRSNPGDIHRVGTEDDLQAVYTQPKISEAISVLEQTLKLWADGEGLPIDRFTSAQVLTGDALVAAERDLARRRESQLALAPGYERECYEKLRSVWNAFASTWGRAPLADGFRLQVSIGRSWQPKNYEQLQNSLMKDLAVGAISIIDYYQTLYGMDRESAIRHHERVQADRRRFPVAPALEMITEGVATRSTATQVAPGQNPGAVISGPNPPGVDAAPTPGALNPRIARSVEGASVVAAAGRATTS